MPRSALRCRCRLVNQRRLIDPRQIEALANSSHPQHLTTTTHTSSTTSSHHVLPNPGSLCRQEALASQCPQASRQLVRQCFWLPTARSPVCYLLPRCAQLTCAPAHICAASLAESFLSFSVPTISSLKRAPRSKPPSSVSARRNATTASSASAAPSSVASPTSCYRSRSGPSPRRIRPTLCPSSSSLRPS